MSDLVLHIDDNNRIYGQLGNTKESAVFTEVLDEGFDNFDHNFGELPDDARLLHPLPTVEVLTGDVNGHPRIHVRGEDVTYNISYTDTVESLNKEIESQSAWLAGLIFYRDRLVAEEEAAKRAEAKAEEARKAKEEPSAPALAFDVPEDLSATYLTALGDRFQSETQFSDARAGALKEIYLAGANAAAKHIGKDVA